MYALLIKQGPKYVLVTAWSEKIRKITFFNKIAAFGRCYKSFFWKRGSFITYPADVATVKDLLNAYQENVQLGMNETCLLFIKRIVRIAEELKDKVDFLWALQTPMILRNCRIQRFTAERTGYPRHLIEKLHALKNNAMIVALCVWTCSYTYKFYELKLKMQFPFFLRKNSIYLRNENFVSILIQQFDGIIYLKTYILPCRLECLEEESFRLDPIVGIATFFIALFATETNNTSEVESFIDRHNTINGDDLGLQDFIPYQMHRHGRACLRYLHRKQVCRFNMSYIPWCPGQKYF